ncbi:MAG: hypothetical protein ACKV19_27240 [Verrucomicrobiales bacterium]
MRLTSNRSVLTCFVLVALAVAQVFGVVKGYWCSCSEAAEVVTAAVCDASICHPGERHVHAGSERGAGEEGETDPCGPRRPSDDHSHEHPEVRDDLITGSAAPGLSVLPPDCWDWAPSLMSPFLGHEVEALVATAPPRSVWLEDGSPPTPLLVAQTVVRLV